MPFRDAWLVIGGFLLIVGFAAAQPAIVVVGLVTIVIGGLSRYWSRRLFDRVRFTSTMRERRTFIGESVLMDVHLENEKPLPLPWYEWRVGLIEALPVEGEEMGASASPGLSWLIRRGALGWYAKHDWTFTVRPAERGFHPFGMSTLRSADLLGVFPRTLTDERPQHLVVYPRVFSFEELGLPSERPFGERKGGNRIFEDPLRIAGLREYRPGDPLRRIDWKATARSGDLQSRVYEPSATQQLYLMVNIDTMEHVWEGYLRDELEMIASVSASVAVWAGGARYAVGLLANGAFPDADRPIRIAPSRSNDQVARVLEALAVIQPLTMGDLAGAIARESGRLPAGSTIVVVAAMVPAALAATLERLQSEGHKVFVIAVSDRARDATPRTVPVHRIKGAFEREVAAT
jgi:uncharacterized protein (DUF58 family)